MYKNIESFTILDQFMSIHYKNQYQNILYNKIPDLINYHYAKKAHNILIDCLIPHFENEKLPIT
jgi:hypothetical protein